VDESESFSYANMFWILFGSGIVETVLILAWNKPYFTIGIPILELRVNATPADETAPNQSDLAANFLRKAGPSYDFHAFDLKTVAFREKLFDFSNATATPIMHGSLLFDYPNRQVIIKGLVNWTFLVLAFFWMIFAARVVPPVMLIVFVPLSIVIIVIQYRVQHRRYIRVAEFAAQVWSRRAASSQM
jgi:hypothetical protein